MAAPEIPTSNDNNEEEDNVHHDDDDVVEDDEDDDVAQQEEPSSPTSFNSIQMVPDMFRDDVRQDWIDAIFGKDFYTTPDFQPPRQGAGASGIGSYCSYSCTIPANAKEQGDKVGITLSRIALGLYVRRVDSEAKFAGIEEGSILMDVNGVAMLGEPSRQALERMWYYESSDRTRPLALRLYKSGRGIYTSLLFSSSSSSCIAWGPCANFALVQKVYSFAQAAGARRGCLVASINDVSNIRTLTHEGAARDIRQGFTQGDELHLVFLFTPAASRSSGSEQQADKKKKATPTTKQETARHVGPDGVQVRVHPMEYGRFFSCGLGGSNNNNNNNAPRGQGTRFDLAARVVAGVVESPFAPPSELTVSKQYGKCPSLQALLPHWDSMTALLYLMQVHQAGYDEDLLLTMSSSSEVVLQDDLSGANAFLLQWVSVLCEEEEDESSSLRRELASMLLTMSRRDDDFCQRLHFVLRSYTATLEGERKKVGGRNVLTLLQALERLRAAQKQLKNQLMNKDTPVIANSNSASTTEPGLTSDSQDGSMVATSTSSSPTEDEGKEDTKTTPSKKPKSVFKLFRKKKSSNPSNTATTSMRKRHSTPDLPSLSPANNNDPAMKKRVSSLTNLAMQLDYLSVSSLLENMNRFLTELDDLTDTIERSLLKSISQKMAQWALQPWSASKESELAKVTQGLRDGLRHIMALQNPPSPLVNPVAYNEVLTSVDSAECYILPSAHFPLLLTFNVDTTTTKNNNNTAPPHYRNSFLTDEKLYRTKVQVVAVRGSASPVKSKACEDQRAYVVQAAVAGAVKESGRSTKLDRKSKIHGWDNGGGFLVFDSRSSWGPPQTLSLGLLTVAIDDNGHEQVVHSDDNGRLHYASDIGHCWVDMRSLWNKTQKVPPATVTCHAQVCSLEATEPFDQHGEIRHGMAPTPERLELELRVTTEILQFDQADSGYQSRKRMLLYKHDDDMRQEMFAIQFIDTCGAMLKVSGLDLKLLTFRCIPVGSQRGFIEWIPGTVPLSDICQAPFAVLAARSPSDEDRRAASSHDEDDDDDERSEVAKAGLFKYQSLHGLQKPSKKGQRNDIRLDDNPIQDFLRSVAYDADAPYFIARDVMDNYVKSCAGYSVITYILGVGDRHLDNLLLHQSGHFFHCDYSFILGNDPKKYLPMRITEDMVQGMGGRDGDLFADMFLSLCGAAFLALRRPENVRVLLSMVRLMAPSAIPDVSIHQNVEAVLQGMMDRLQLSLSDADAISYMEQLVEDSISSKMIWKAVDAIHALGKRI